MSFFKEKLELDIQEAELFAQKGLGRYNPATRWLIILTVLAIIPAYYISRGISQKIWTDRYQQGVIAAKPSFTNPEPPKISDISITMLTPGSYAAALQISNQNLDLSLDNVPYSINFFNVQKQQIYSYSDKLFLIPNQTEYLVVPTFSTSQQPAYAQLHLPPSLPWQKRLSIPAVNFLTSLPDSFEQSLPAAFVVSGDFVNNSPYSLATVHLTFVLFDSSQKIIGCSSRDEFTVLPFERRSYKQLWPNMQALNLDHVDVSVDTDTLDPNNLSVPDTGSSSAGDLSRPSQSRQ